MSAKAPVRPLAGALLLLLGMLVLIPLAVLGGGSVEENVMALGGTDRAAREEAGRALAKAGASAVPVLLDAVMRNPDLRMSVLAVFREMNGAAVKPLLERLSDRKVGRLAGSAIPYAVPADAGDFVEEMLDCLRTKSAAQQACGMGLLKSLGPKAKKRVPLLITSLKEGDPVVRVHAAAGLGRVSVKAGVVPLTEALKDPVPAVRAAAARALGAIGRPAKGSLEALRALEADPDGETAAAAREAAGKVRG